MIVVDASIGVKWFLEEAGSTEATALLVEHPRELFAPDMFGIEVAGALVRECNIAQSKAVEAEPSQFSWALGRLGRLLESGAVNLMRTDLDALNSAANWALDLGHPIKDCLYLVLAMDKDCHLVTADAKFARKAREVYKGVRLLNE